MVFSMRSGEEGPRTRGVEVSLQSLLGEEEPVPLALRVILAGSLGGLFAAGNFHYLWRDGVGGAALLCLDSEPSLAMAAFMLSRGLLALLTKLYS